MSDTNYAVAPGEYLEEWMDDHGKTREYVADRMVIEPGRVDRIINGTEQLTSYLRQQLHALTGIPERIWERQEAQYRADLKRLQIPRV